MYCNGLTLVSGNLICTKIGNLLRTFLKHKQYSALSKYDILDVLALRVFYFLPKSLLSMFSVSSGSTTMKHALALSTRIRIKSLGCYIVILI